MTLATADHFKERGWLASLVALLDMCPSDDAAAEAIRLAEATRLRFHPPGSKLVPFEQLGGMEYSDGKTTIRMLMSRNN
jgi:hypothetical protein